jgi:3-hydroxybutyryl-CoA dehydratase
VKGLEIGQTATKRRTFSHEDVIDYRALTGDRIDAGMVPAPLIGGMFSDLLGTELPGRGTNWMKQSFRFVCMAHVDTELVATVEVVRLRPEKDLVNLRTICTDAFGRLICDGEALVMAREMAAD